MSYIFTPNDIAVFLIKAKNFTISDEPKVIHDLWESGEHIAEEYLHNEALFKRHIWGERSSYYMQKDDMDELALIMRDIDPNYAPITPAYEQNFLLQYFKVIRLELIYIGGKESHKLKLRTLLQHFDYKRRSKELVEKIDHALTILSLKPYTRGRVPCDIAKIDIDDWIMIRLK